MAATIDEVIARMRVIASKIPAPDGVRRFNMVYLRTTEAIRDRLGDGFFDDDSFVARFDVVFAGHYFAAIDADAGGQRVDAAWRPLFSRRSDQRVHAVQFVLAGMNAHINHDLALAVVEICTLDRTYPLAGNIPSDFRKINEVLEAIESEVRHSLLQELEVELGQELDPLVHVIDSWSIRQAREAAWVRAQVLWLLRNSPILYSQVVDVSARTAGMTSEQLLTPLL